MVALFLLLSGCDIVAHSVLDRAADPADPTPHVVEIPEGTTARAVGPLLQQAGVIDDAERFTWYVRMSGEGGCLKAGRFKLRRDMTAEQIIDALCGSPLPEDVPFTVVEGWRIQDIDAALAKRGWIQAGAYTALANHPGSFHAPYPLPKGTLEGYLYPETYYVTPDRFDPAKFIQRQLDEFAQRFWTPHQGEIAHSKRSLEDLVIMASLVEREEPDPKNRPLIAGILWKRLDHGWNLGVDATSRYLLARWNDREAFLEKLRDAGDPYNTRLRPGLPPTPIGNPGEDALEAALDPVQSDYWYYLHDAERRLHMSKTVAQHERYRREFGVY